MHINAPCTNILCKHAYERNAREFGQRTLFMATISTVDTARFYDEYRINIQRIFKPNKYEQSRINVCKRV